jgi:tripartite-type tricarboxylate transporter receptor subunit TctC
MANMKPAALAKSIAVLVLVALAAIPAAWAQSDYPSKSVRIIVPSSAGGGTDTVARLLAQHLTEKLGQSFFVENRPGGGSATGIEAAARAAPDGYTLVVVASTMTSLHVARKTMRFDAVKDFAPITLAVSIPNVLVVHPSLPAKTFAEFVALAKKEPGKLSFASPGLGSTTHMGMELLKSKLGLDILHVPNNGVAPALTDVLGGRVPVMMVNTVVTKQHLDDHALRALAVSTAARSRVLPDVPTIAESGVPGYDVFQWFGLLAPAGTPRPVVDRLYREIAAGLKLPKVQRWAETEGGDIVASTPDEFQKVIAADVARWTDVAKIANIKAN